MSHHRRTIALLVDSMNSEYTVQLWQAVQRAADARKVNTLAFAGLRLGGPSVIEATQNRIYELVNAKLVDGVILVTSVLAHYCGTEGIKALCDSYAPLPLCSVGLEVAGIPSLVVDNAGGMERGVGHLLDAHHRRRIAFVAAQPNSEESNLRLSGYRRAHEIRGIPIDDELLYHADFTVPGGVAAIRSLLDRKIEFDAVMAANDYMALGVMDVLQERGRTGARAIPVLGFDDIRAASCAKPSLSTLRQPMSWLGSEALNTILSQLDGKGVPPCSVGVVELVRRESCGCSYALATSVRSPDAPTGTLSEALAAHRDNLQQLMYDEVLTSNQGLGQWPNELLDALNEELAADVGRFAACFDGLLDRAEAQGVNLDEFQRLISLLRRETRRFQLKDRQELDQLERLWHAARIAIAAASIRTVGRHRIEMEHVTTLVGRSGERFATTLSLPLLKQALIEELPGFGIRQASITLYKSGFGSVLRPLVLQQDGADLTPAERDYGREELVPIAGLERPIVPHSLVLPLTFEGDFLGIGIFSVGAMPHVYWEIRQQIGSAIKGAQLHRQIVAQVALRERLDQQQASEQARVAAEIQTSMLPAVFNVIGLDVADIMIPAAESGGDYYDVIPDAKGAWITIGDVTGHGLGAGLIMLMLQGMISSLVRNDRQIAPSRLLNAVNETIYDNVRNRLRRDEHATLTAIRYERSGALRFSGAHEPLLIYRAATGKVETTISPGVWVGAVPDVADLMTDATLQLQDGDILLLHTDGITEPRNAHLEQFGLERLIALLETSGRRTVTEIRDEVVAAVTAWSSNLDDDLTLLVLRYNAAIEA